MNIAQRFSEFTKPNFFSRVDVNHSLEIHIGLDNTGRKSIELRGLFLPKKVTGTSSIEVNQYQNENYNTIRFTLVDDDICGLFCKFCEDLIEQTRNTSNVNEGYVAITNRFFQWKKLFINKKNDHLSESEIMGLIGELLFLKELCLKIEINKAISSWSGQDYTHKDFSVDNNWIEIKTISAGKPTVKISSLQQLEGNDNGVLVVYSLEKMSEAYQGLTINGLVLDILSIITDEEYKDEFLNKVLSSGYEYCSYYDAFVYELTDVKKYNVSQDFPKLTSTSVPKQVVKASYELLLSGISEFEMLEEQS